MDSSSGFVGMNVEEKRALYLIPGGKGGLIVPPSGNGRIQDHENRLRVIEGDVREIKTELRHMATKEDISSLKELISAREARLLRWLMGLCVTALVSIALALVSTIVVLLRNPPPPTP